MPLLRELPPEPQNGRAESAACGHVGPHQIPGLWPRNMLKSPQGGPKGCSPGPRTDARGAHALVVSMSITSGLPYYVQPRIPLMSQSPCSQRRPLTPAWFKPTVASWDESISK